MRTRTLAMMAAATVGATTLAIHAVGAEKNTDHQQITEAVLDYVEGIYEVEPERIARSVHPDLVKFGFWHSEESGEWAPMPMTFEQLKALAGQWNADGHLPADAPKKIVVHDVRNMTASASLDAAWGMDHMQLVKEDGKWMILHVLWQSTPEYASH